MNRSDYDEYLRRFNAKDYAGVYDFYEPGTALSFFGVTLDDGDALARFYGFLHSYVRETVTVTRFAASDELLALEAVVHIEGMRELTREALDAHGLYQFHPIRAGEVMEMEQMIHYHVRNGRFIAVRCAML